MALYGFSKGSLAATTFVSQHPEMSDTLGKVVTVAPYKDYDLSPLKGKDWDNFPDLQLRHHSAQPAPVSGSRPARTLRKRSKKSSLDCSATKLKLRKRLDNQLRPQQVHRRLICRSAAFRRNKRQVQKFARWRSATRCGNSWSMLPQKTAYGFTFILAVKKQQARIALDRIGMITAALPMFI